MKFVMLKMENTLYQSLSARRVWIEIKKESWNTERLSSLSARRVWIEISMVEVTSEVPVSHSLRGECGLKSSQCIVPSSTADVTLCEESVD